MDWQRDLQIRGPATAAFLPPVTVRETGWDILLALHSDERCELSLDKLALLVSAPPKTVTRWLDLFRDRRLVIAKRHDFTGELRAVLTSYARQLVDRYLSATDDLQAGTRL